MRTRGTIKDRKGETFVGGNDTASIDLLSTPLGRISSRHQYGSQTIDVNHVSASVTADDADKQFDAAEMKDMLPDKLPMNRKTLH